MSFFPEVGVENSLKACIISSSLDILDSLLDVDHDSISRLKYGWRIGFWGDFARRYVTSNQCEKYMDYFLSLILLVDVLLEVTIFTYFLHKNIFVNSDVWEVVGFFCFLGVLMV